LVVLNNDSKRLVQNHFCKHKPTLAYFPARIDIIMKTDCINKFDNEFFLITVYNWDI